MQNEPITREEILLNAVATGEAENLEPITREEMFLAKLGGADVTTPMPITRKEQFLQKAIEGGDAGGSSSDPLAQAMAGTLKNYTSDAVVETLMYGSFHNNNAIESINMPNLHNVLVSLAFANCSALREVYMPSLTSTREMMFNNCTSLKKADFSSVVSFANSVFANCTVFDTLILRNSFVVGLTTFGVFTNSPFITSKGTVYCPRELIEAYQSATNWSVLYTEGTCQFVAIEGSEYE